MDASHTQMTFFSASNTALLFPWWTPSSEYQYATTCCILVLVAGSFRALLSYKHMLERHWLHEEKDNRDDIFDHIPLARFHKRSKVSSGATLESNGGEEQVGELGRAIRSKHPWRFSVDVPRAFLVTMISTLGYFLMLAVMSLNIGYFCSVVGGIFGGELLVGRYNHSVADH